MKRVILDMDPGVDDALAIILAVLSPELKIEAITTVSGNVRVGLCTRNVLRVLEILKPEVPPLIVSGEAKPIAADEFLNASEVHGKDGLGNLDRFITESGMKRYPEPSLYSVSPDHAVDVMLSLIADHPGEITLVSTGPLTNIARAITRDRDCMENIKDLIVMGGAFKVPGNVTPVAEFNIFFDPHAADIVAGSGLPVTFVGLDVTHQVRLSETIIRDQIKPLDTKLSQFVYDITSFYVDFHKEYDGFAGCYLHDPLAVGVAIKPDLVETEALCIEIETQGKVTRGMTVADLRPIRRHDRNPNARVCTEVNSSAFLSLFLDTIASYER